MVSWSYYQFEAQQPGSLHVEVLALLAFYMQDSLDEVARLLVLRAVHRLNSWEAREQ